MNLVGQYFVEDSYICVHLGSEPVISFSCSVLVWFWHQGNGWLCEMSLEVFCPLYVLNFVDVLSVQLPLAE